MNLGLKTVILFFNKPSLTLRCLESVERAVKNLPASFASETLLIDNGSQARVLSVRNTIHRLEQNAGFAKGMNFGLAKAFKNPKAQFVLTLSNDVELPEDFFSALAALTLDPRVPALHCPSVFFLMDREKPSYTHGRVDPETMELSHLFEPGRTQEIRFPEYYPAAALLWSRAAFERLKGFNESYFCYWEDVELSLRASQNGVQLLPTPQLKTFHLGRGTTGGKSQYSLYFSEGRERTKELMARRVVS